LCYTKSKKKDLAKIEARIKNSFTVYCKGKKGRKMLA
jgi:hypothetical protein